MRVNTDQPIRVKQNALRWPAQGGRPLQEEMRQIFFFPLVADRSIDDAAGEEVDAAAQI
jgi:hypothetical protein